MRKKLRKKDLPEIIFFEEKVGSNGIHCLDYKSSSNIKYIREDVVKNISSNPMLADRLPINLILYRQAKKLDYAEFCKWLNAKCWHNSTKFNLKTK